MDGLPLDQECLAVQGVPSTRVPGASASLESQCLQEVASGVCVSVSVCVCACVESHHTHTQRKGVRMSVMGEKTNRRNYGRFGHVQLRL